MIDRAGIETYLKNAINENPTLKLGDRSYGHSVGDQFEDWAYSKLQGISSFQTWRPHEFLNRVVEANGGMPIAEELYKTNWARLHLLSTIKNISKYEKKQQDGADIILYYGSDDMITDLNKVVLLNIKSHALAKKSRDPNIMSAQRLLVFFQNILSNPNLAKNLEQISYWILGFTHEKDIIKNAIIKDLFLLDVNAIPQINFDSAIQIQWHVDKMVEIPSQTRKKFIKDFTQRFDNDWKKHQFAKNEKYKTLITNVKSSLTKI